MKDYMLANNISIPSIGFGTWTLDEHDICVAAVTAALESGYRHIDTAAIYKNEAFIGEALKQSSIKREDIFITTKLWNDVRGYDETIQAFETSIAKLGIDYIDLYLIHWPNPVKYRTNWKQMNAESYRAMEDLYNQGKIRAIGVSNFMEHHLDALLETCKIIPMVNQIELHPGLLQNNIVHYCRQKNILIEAYSPLGRAKLLDKLELRDIADKYNCSVAQIILRWQLQKGYLPLPRSTNAKRIKQNIQVFDFTLDDNDIAYIDNLAYDDVSSNKNPDTIEF